MSFFTISGNKLAMTVLAAGALAVGGTGVAAMAESAQDSPPVVAATESPSPTPTETETASPTLSETESPAPTPTETETAAPEPTPTETDAPEPSPTGTADPEPAPTSTAAGPDATGPAAFGLCNAFTNGGLSSTSTAFAALAEAAGRESGIDAYCTTVTAPEDGDGDAGLPTGDQAQPGAMGQQQVKEQRQDAGASSGAAGHQSSTGAKHSNGGQR